jgi:hypothetical protein
MAKPCGNLLDMFLGLGLLAFSCAKLGSSLNMKKLKALTQGTCPGDFRMARSFSGDLLFLYI